MTDMHLTDHQIQEYLDHENSLPEPALDHLTSCPECRRLLESYRAFFSQLTAVRPPELSPNFADHVMTRLPSESPTPARAGSPWLVAASVAVGAALILLLSGTLIQYLYPAFSTSLLEGLKVSTQQAESLLQTYSSSVSSQLVVKPLMILFAMLTLGGIALVDRVIVHYRRSRRLISLLA